MMNRIATIILSGLALSVGAAGAATIPISGPPYGEAGHKAILESLYSGVFTAVGDDFLGSGAAAGIQVLRQDDFLAPMGVLSVTDGARGSAADAIWAGGVISATAQARYAGHSQRFGFDRGNGFELLFDVQGSGMNVTGSASVDLRDDTWRWVRRKQDNTNTWYSDPLWNDDGMDHMVTYRVTGLDTDETVWLLFWEDLPKCSSDRDYNDLVVEIRALPEPATLAWTTLGGVVVLFGYRRRLL
jgi:hypothetical protein